MKKYARSLPEGEVLVAGPASALSVLSASASLSLKHDIKSNKQILKSFYDIYFDFMSVLPPRMSC